MTTPSRPATPNSPAASPAGNADNGPAKRGRKPGQKAKVRAELPAEAFNIQEAAEETRVLHKRRREERSDQQKAIDKLVADIYQNWLKANRPTNWADMPVYLWTLPTKFVEDAEFYLRKAAQLHGRKLIFGHKEEKDGKTTLPFCVIARQQKTPKGTTSDDE